MNPKLTPPLRSSARKGAMRNSRTHDATHAELFSSGGLIIPLLMDPQFPPKAITLHLSICTALLNFWARLREFLAKKA